MRDYVLRSGARNDNAPAFVQRAMMWAKGTNELHGIIRGVLVDGFVSDREAEFLKNWILSRPDVIGDALVARLADRLVRVCEDGIVTQDESDELKQIFSAYLGQPDEGVPTDLPLDEPPPELKIEGSLFCFTGTFVSGTRRWCEEQTVERGGQFTDQARPGIDYLVIGSRVSRGWVNQSYGRKIQTIVGYRDSVIQEPTGPFKRTVPKIVVEDHWLRYL